MKEVLIVVESIKQCKKCKPNLKMFTSLKFDDNDASFLIFWDEFIDGKRLKNFCKNESYNQDFENNICPFCKGKLIDTMLTRNDFYAIGEASNYNRDLLLAMIDLRKKDVIEFETRMQPFRQKQEEHDREQKRRAEERLVKLNKVLHCPYCNSTNVRKITGTERAVSVGMLGLFSKKLNKSFKCKNCGGTF